jgi:LacI family transcriptional regulator
MRGIAGAIASSRYELIVYTVQSSEQLEEYLTTLPISHRVDGLIIMSLPLRPDAAAALTRSGLPTVCIEYSRREFNAVEIDNEAGGRLAGDYLIGLGRKRLAIVGEIGEPDYALHPSMGRLNGFRNAVADAGIGLPEAYVRLQPFKMGAVAKVAHGLLALAEPPDAIFATSDVQAISVLKALRSAGVAVPAEVAVLGFDNIDAADYVGLTTVDQSLDDSGRIALELLLAGMADSSRPVRHVRLQLQIVERETTPVGDLR